MPEPAADPTRDTMRGANERRIRRNLDALKDGAAARRCVSCPHLTHNDLGYCQTSSCSCSNGTTVAGTAMIIARDVDAMLAEHVAHAVASALAPIQAALDDPITAVIPNEGEPYRVWQERAVRAALESALAPAGAPTAPTAAPRCWCGGQIGPRLPGDPDGLGCLTNILHAHDTPPETPPARDDRPEQTTPTTAAEVHRSDADTALNSHAPTDPASLAAENQRLHDTIHRAATTARVNAENARARGRMSDESDWRSLAAFLLDGTLGVSGE